MKDNGNWDYRNWKDMISAGYKLRDVG